MRNGLACGLVDLNCPCVGLGVPKCGQFDHFPPEYPEPRSQCCVTPPSPRRPADCSAPVSRSVATKSNVVKAEGDVAEAWVAYGAALNVGRALFASDEQFGQWVRDSQLARDGITFDERSAAMWAAANPDDFAGMRTDFPGVRTVRGWHSKWQDGARRRLSVAWDQVFEDLFLRLAVCGILFPQRSPSADFRCRVCLYFR